MNPVTSVGMAKGMSISALKRPLAGKWKRTRTYAVRVPITALITVISTDVISVSFSAEKAVGFVMSAQKAVNPSAKPFLIIVASGRATIKPRYRKAVKRRPHLPHGNITRREATAGEPLRFAGTLLISTFEAPRLSSKRHLADHIFRSKLSSIPRGSRPARDLPPSEIAPTLRLIHLLEQPVLDHILRSPVAPPQ